MSLSCFEEICMKFPEVTSDEPNSDAQEWEKNGQLGYGICDNRLGPFT